MHEVNGWFIIVRIFVYVEEWRRKEQNSQKMFQIQNILVTQDGRGIQLVKPTRRMLREGQVQESPGNSNISDHNWGSGQVHLLFLRYSMFKAVNWYLFNDILIRATGSLLSSKQTVKSYSHISDVFLHDLYAEGASIVTSCYKYY